jgi:hypothetical protein
MLFIIIDGKAIGEGNESEDLPLQNYSTLSGKKRRVKLVVVLFLFFLSGRVLFIEELFQ